ncbi:MAG: nicotinate-nucleotide diphosphorylase (carboxylating) [Candidatus Dadabacteria bacterium RIFCSPHIGHO2_12_FULL_53_21]|nr:MAG: nicotinate-nucleotide diphosphorylase (carboxylating) [Candidatus Dadabacteria bacterium RIFCSPHIGHO2_12_FULL_53_21]
MKKIELDFNRVDRIIEYALREDLGDGDITTNSLATEKEDSKAVIRAKAKGVAAGLPIAKRVFQKLDPTVVCIDNISDGENIKPGDIISEINGGTRALLSGERLALNILQRLSGIATLTSKYVKAVEGLPVKILDTRKTAPGLRILDKYAVSVGGGYNHRFGLFDGVLIKDNHIEIAGGIAEAVAVIRKKYRQKYKIEVETSGLEQVKEALIAGADIIMLDNMSPEQMRKAVRLIDRNALVEASGGINIKNVREVAETGVNFISVGALTHSASALDIGLYVV